jgi:hypothetical protein
LELFIVESDGNGIAEIEDGADESSDENIEVEDEEVEVELEKEGAEEEEEEEEEWWKEWKSGTKSHTICFSSDKCLLFEPVSGLIWGGFIFDDVLGVWVKFVVCDALEWEESEFAVVFNWFIRSRERGAIPNEFEFVGWRNRLCVRVPIDSPSQDVEFVEYSGTADAGRGEVSWKWFESVSNACCNVEREGENERAWDGEGGPKRFEFSNWKFEKENEGDWGSAEYFRLWESDKGRGVAKAFENSNRFVCSMVLGVVSENGLKCIGMGVRQNGVFGSVGSDLVVIFGVKLMYNSSVAFGLFVIFDGFVVCLFGDRFG